MHSIDLEKLYRVFPWPEDIESQEFMKRFDQVEKFLRRVIEHPWIRDAVLKKNRLRVLDLCGGTGIAGIALAKVLIDQDKNVDITVIDKRRSALEKASLLAKKVLDKGYELKTIAMDVLDMIDLDIKADIALLFGYSTPHFDAYQLVTLTAIVANKLVDDGIYLVEEVDRLYTIFYLMGYERVHVEYANENRIVLVVHAGYEPRTGTFNQIIVEIPSMERAFSRTRLWDLASVAAILWIFFEDVDFEPLKSAYSGVLIARNPRNIDPRIYLKKPRIVEAMKSI